MQTMCLSSDKTVLEIGVGTGRLADRVAPRCAHLTGIDLSPKTVERARENLQRHGNVELICDDFCTHVFQKTYDVVYSSLTMMHFRDKAQVLEKVASLLKTGGIFCLSIDKNQSPYIDMGTRKLEIYPDRVEQITDFMTASRMTVEGVTETPMAYLIVGIK